MYQLHTTTSGSGEDGYEYEKFPSGADAAAASDPQLGWSYVDYMKAAGLDPDERKSRRILHQ